MNLIELNDDCLHEIFLYLDVNELAIVADVCTHFQRRAALTFSRKFNNKRIVLDNFTPKSRIEASRILRVFGQLINKVKLLLKYNKSDSFFNAVMKNCALTVTDIDLDSPVWEFEIILKNDILIKFKNLRRLAISAPGNINLQCIEGTFSALEHLSLSCTSFESNHLRVFIKLNSHLKSLELTDSRYGGKINRNFLAFIDTNLPQLEHFGLSVRFGTTFKNLPYQPLFFKNLKSLRITDINAHSDFFAFLAISNMKIEKMNLYVHWCDERLIDQIGQYHQLKKLTLFTDNGIDSSAFDKISKKLVYLTEVVLYDHSGFCSYVDSVIKFIENSKRIRRFYFKHLGNEKSILKYFANVKNKLSASEWEIGCLPKNCSLEIRKKITN